MKKILLIILVLISVQSFGQIWKLYGMRQNTNGTVDSFFTKFPNIDSVFNSNGNFVSLSVETYPPNSETPSAFENYTRNAKGYWVNQNLLVNGITKVPDVVQTAVNNKTTYYVGVDAGANDSYVVTLSPVPASLTAGMIVIFKANTANTTGCTLNVNGLGVVNIVKRVSTTPATGDILSQMWCMLIYNGGTFVLLNPVAN